MCAGTVCAALAGWLLAPTTVIVEYRRKICSTSASTSADLIAAQYVQTVDGPGTLDWHQITDNLVAQPVAAALADWPAAAEVLVAPIDADLADTAAFCTEYAVAPEESANCVVIAGRRGDVTRYAACMVLATTRADVNGVVRKRLEARKASFAPMEDAVTLTGMEFGGITPIGLPSAWPILIDAAVLDRDVVVIGSGLRRSKLALPSRLLAELPAAEVVDGLAH
jgi:prolyl-tRNA editing enzyme YbaK/EbsC (Cys-tRNA(Pro) deacylase)